MNKALTVMDLMSREAPHVKPGVLTYTTLIDSWIEEDQLDKGLETYATMKELSIKPSTATYNSLITIYGKKNIMAGILDTFRELEKSGLRTNKSTYEALIGAFIRCDQVSEIFFAANDLLTVTLG